MSAPDDLKRDLEWMTAYRQDDPDAFAKIYAAYADPVYGYLVKRMATEAERDDLFQKIWIKFHRARDQWSPEYPLLQWLFVIARSVRMDQYRENSHSPFGLVVDDSDRALARMAAPESPVGNDDGQAEEEALSKKMARQGLSEEQVEVVRQRVFAEEDYNAIAARLGKSPVSVRKIFSRAIEKMRVAGNAGSRS